MWTMSKKPKVSILTITYNHDKFIREALDSLLAQKTDFDFEVIVADDCSTDRTQDIIREYSRAYPGIFKPILRQKNIGAVANSIDTLQAATGEYIALCEGDDYWTDPDKLQKQANFLDKHSEYALCFHPVKVVFEDDSKKKFIYPEVNKNSNFTLDGLLRSNYIQTNSVMYRKQKYDKIPSNILPLDWFLHLYNAQFGKIGFINQIMSAYRRHPGGLWWDSDKDIDKIWRAYGIPHLNLYLEILKLYGKNPEHKQIIYGHIEEMLNNFIGTDKKDDGELLVKALSKFPSVAPPVIVSQHDKLQAREAKLQKQEQHILDLSESLRQKDLQLDQKKELIRQMKASRFWKLRNLVARLIGKTVI